MITKEELSNLFDNYIAKRKEHLEAMEEYAIAKTNHDANYQKMLFDGIVYGKNDDARMGCFIGLVPDMVETLCAAKSNSASAEIESEIAYLKLEKAKFIVKHFPNE